MGPGPAARTRGRAVEIQRARVLAAMVAIVGEHGYKAASVEAVVKRARVSRRTFYALFESIEDCFAAVLAEGLERSSAIMSEAFEREETWEDGVRGGLAGLLVYFDSEPVLARVWLIESLAAASWAFEQRERYVAVLRALVISNWEPPGGHESLRPSPDSPPVVGVMAAVLGVIHTHLLTKQPDPFIVLLGPLMGIVTAAYLGPDATAREVKRGEELTRSLLAEPYPPPHWPAHPAVSVEIPDVLRDPRARRARLCLLYLLRDPGASNREVGSGVGISSHTQISQLLARLCGLGLLLKVEGGPGRPNAWSLSERGIQVAHAIEASHIETLTDHVWPLDVETDPAHG
jgi:AcrR family transcriptional regulator